jgi:hypothetical protein
VYVTFCERNFRRFRSINQALFVALVSSTAIFGNAPPAVLKTIWEGLATRET